MIDEKFLSGEDEDKDKDSFNLVRVMSIDDLTVGGHYSIKRGCFTDITEFFRLLRINYQTGVIDVSMFDIGLAQHYKTSLYLSDMGIWPYPNGSLNEKNYLLCVDSS